jgi:hypothetical protein
MKLFYANGIKIANDEIKQTIITKLEQWVKMYGASSLVTINFDEIISTIGLEDLYSSPKFIEAIQVTVASLSKIMTRRNWSMEIDADTAKLFYSIIDWARARMPIDQEPLDAVDSVRPSWVPPYAGTNKQVKPEEIPPKEPELVQKTQQPQQPQQIQQKPEEETETQKPVEAFNLKKMNKKSSKPSKLFNLKGANNETL